MIVNSTVDPDSKCPSRYLVTIVTVSLNAIETIYDTLTSVAGQQATFEIEHLCIDGGSKDGTRQCIEKHAHLYPNVRFLFEPDAGLFDAMNKGARMARGKYVIYLNADDFLASPTSIENAFPKYIRAALPDLVIGTVVMGRLDQFGMKRMRVTPRWLLRYPLSGAHPPHQATFIKTELLLSIGGFDIKARAASDTITFYKAMRLSPQPTMYITNAVVSFMRAGGVSNGGMKEYLKGNFETYRFLCVTDSRLNSTLRVAVKILQKFWELRMGTLHSSQWRWWTTEKVVMRTNNDC